MVHEEQKHGVLHKLFQKVIQIGVDVLDKLSWQTNRGATWVDNYVNIQNSRI